MNQELYIRHTANSQITFSPNWDTDGSGTGTSSYIYDANGNLDGRYADYDGTPVYDFIDQGDTDGDGEDDYTWGITGYTGSYHKSETFTINYSDDLLLVHQVGYGDNASAGYAYDVNGRRLSRSLAGGPATEYFIYDGDELVATVAASGSVNDRYLHGDAPESGGNQDQTLAEDRAGNKARWTLTDNIGSVRDTVDNTGSHTVLDHITYDTYGNITAQSSSTNSIRMGFAGYVWDAEENDYYAGNRNYDPVDGRFFEEDPMGFDDGMGLYPYVHNHPTYATDPTGLETNLGVGSFRSITTPTVEKADPYLNSQETLAHVNTQEVMPDPFHVDPPPVEISATTPYQTLQATAAAYQYTPMFSDEAIRMASLPIRTASEIDAELEDNPSMGWGERTARVVGGGAAIVFSGNPVGVIYGADLAISGITGQPTYTNQAIDWVAQQAGFSPEASHAIANIGELALPVAAESAWSSAESSWLGQSALELAAPTYSYTAAVSPNPYTHLWEIPPAEAMAGSSIGPPEVNIPVLPSRPVVSNSLSPEEQLEQIQYLSSTSQRDWELVKNLQRQLPGYNPNLAQAWNPYGLQTAAQYTGPNIVGISGSEMYEQFGYAADSTKPYVIGEVRPYNEARTNKYLGYDDHHLDPPLGRNDPNYNSGPTIPIRNDNTGGKITGGVNVHTAENGFQQALNQHIKDLGFTRQQWNALPETTRMTHLQRYYSSFGIPFPG